MSGKNGSRHQPTVAVVEVEGLFVGYDVVVSNGPIAPNRPLEDELFGAGVQVIRPVAPTVTPLLQSDGVEDGE